MIVSGLTLSGTNAANYVLIPQAITAANITPAPLTLTANNQTGTSAALIGFTTSVLASGNTITSMTLTSEGAAGTATVVGSPYIITPSAAAGSGLTNYKITYVPGILTINPVTLIITTNFFDSLNSQIYSITQFDPLSGKGYFYTLIDTSAFAPSLSLNNDGVPINNNPVNMGERILGWWNDNSAEIQGLLDSAAAIPLVGGGIKAAEATEEGAVYVFGKFPEYVQLAEKLDAYTFNLPAKVYNAISAEERWAMNQGVLDSAIESGSIKFSNSTSKAVAGDTFSKELKYFKQRRIDINKIPVIKQ